MLYSIKMRASRTKGNKREHISGAEKILPQSDLCDHAQALIARALSHAKGQPDFINIKIEAASPKEITYIDALPVSTRNVSDAFAGRKAIISLLEKIGVTNANAIMEKFKETYSMRGAMLLDADTLERLEPDKARGIRVTYMGAHLKEHCPVSDTKNHFQEALVLASKVIHAPGIVAEVCMSDDPDYVTGYVAAASLGYVRITKLKQMGCPDGGRIFLFRGTDKERQECIDYLEKRRVLVRGIPNTPCLSTIPSTDNTWKTWQDDLAKRKTTGLYRTMQRITSPQCAHVEADGHDLLLLASNSYLGLADDPRVKNASLEAVEKYGVCSGGSRLTTGNMALHEELEHDLAVFKGTPASILFNTGYMANVGILSALGGKDSVIFSDELNHASIIDGCRLSYAKTIIYRHNDMTDLEQKIKEFAPRQGIIVSDAVFSMDGDIADLPGIISLAQKYNLLSMVDEAHATGVIGKTGHGIVEYFGRKKAPDILMGTLSKALASEGGFACGSQLLIDYLRNTARSFIFSTSLAPAALAAAKEALSILAHEPELVSRLQNNTKVFLETLNAVGVETSSPSAIVPIIIGDAGKAMRLAAELKEKGIYLSAIRYPTVAKGSARLRIAIMATHKENELREAAKKIADAVLSTDH